MVWNGEQSKISAYDARWLDGLQNRDGTPARWCRPVASAEELLIGIFEVLMEEGFGLLHCRGAEALLREDLCECESQDGGQDTRRGINGGLDD